MKILLTTLNTKYVHTNIALKYLYETVKDKDIELKEFTINEPIGKVLREIVKNFSMTERHSSFSNIQKVLLKW